MDRIQTVLNNVPVKIRKTAQKKKQKKKKKKKKKHTPVFKLDDAMVKIRYTQSLMTAMDQLYKIWRRLDEKQK